MLHRNASRKFTLGRQSHRCCLNSENFAVCVRVEGLTHARVIALLYRDCRIFDAQPRLGNQRETEYSVLDVCVVLREAEKGRKGKERLERKERNR